MSSHYYGMNNGGRCAYRPVTQRVLCHHDAIDVPPDSAVTASSMVS